MSNFRDPTTFSHLEQTKDFEQGRIKALQQERINVQKKTFTKWCNSFLSKFGMEIDNLFQDLEDGKRLIKLLEVISGEKLGKPNQGRLKVHRIENVNKALNFVQSKVKLESIGAEDIVSGNPTLILGLIWSIILRFQIQDIEIEVEDDSQEKRSAKEALLLWCQRKTAGYAGVKIVDFSNSWRNGLAFNALIHSQRPELINYNALNPNDNFNNLNNAFESAQKYLGIAKLLDPEDIDVERPDEKSILTYVSYFYHTFAKMKNEAVGGKRIGKIVDYLMDIDRNREIYESDVTSLMNWIHKNIRDLSNFEFPNSLDGIKSLMLVFYKEYMVLDKPPKCRQKIMIEANFYSINMKLNAQGHPNYTPAEGKTISDLENAWSRLEKVEHERNLALKRELHRQEKLEQMYEKFDKKAKLREDWISEMAKILSNSSSFTNSSQLDATFKKLEALSSDFNAGSDRFKRLDQLAQELIHEDYFSKDTVHKRNQKIQSAFNNLIDQFEKRKASMATFQELEFLFQEMENLNNEMFCLEKAFQSKDFGEYLLDADELITKHGILESQIAGISQHLKSVNRRAQQFTRSNLAASSTTSIVSSQSLASSSPSNSISENSSKSLLTEAQLVKEKLDNLNKAFEIINVLCGERRRYLLEHRDFLKFLEEADEEIIWIEEKIRIVKSNDAGHDLGSTQILINKHEQLEDEIKFRHPRIDKIISQSEKMINAQQFGDDEVENIVKRTSEIQGLFKQLKELAAKRKSLLEDSFSSQQYFADANEAEYWMKDKMALVSLNSDCGKDEASTQALLHRHVRIQEEIKAYEAEIRRLTEITDVLIGNRRFSSFPADIKQQLMKNQKRNALASTGEIPTDTEDIEESDSDISAADSYIEEVDFVDEIVEKEVAELVTVQINTNCVKVLYPFSSKHLSIQRGEIMELKEKTNGEWWLVEKSNGQEGYAPANYVKEIGQQTFPKLQKKLVKRPQVVKVEKLVRKPNPLLNTFKNDKKKKGSILRRKTTSIQPRQLQHLNTENLQKRQVDIKFMFNQLFNSSIERRKQLDNTITFYKWLRKYEEFSKWVREKLEEMSLSNQESLLENPDSSKRLYQAFITDFLAYQNEFSQIEKLSDELVSKKLTYVIETSKKAMSHGEIKQKQNALAADYQKLLELKKTWDNSIKAFQCIEKYNSLYAEVSDLVREKLAALQKEELVHENDVRTVRALQKKQEKLERELGPIEKNMLNLKETAQEVNKYFPQEKANVEKKQELINNQWFTLREEVKNRKAKLDEKHGLQRFENELDDFRIACSGLVAQLNELTQPRDLKQHEEMKKKFEELQAEFKNELIYKFNSLKELGQNLLAKRGVAGSVDKVNSSLSQMTSIKHDTANSIDDRSKYLDDYQKYLKFKQDASGMQLLMQDQEAYLQFDEVGSSSSNVDALQKRHDEFIAKLNAQDDKMKILADQLAKLKVNKHFAIQEMEQMFLSLTVKRQKLKQSALDRKNKLAKSKDFYDFKIQCDDLNSWIDERRSVVENANAESGSLAHLEKSMNKHEAIEKELISNRTRLDKLINDGARLSLSIVNEKVQELISVVEKNWLDLENFTKLKGKELQKAIEKAEMNLKINDVENRVKGLENELRKNYANNDLRSSKYALKKHLELKKQIGMEIELLNDMNKESVAPLENKNKNNSQQELKNVLKAYLNSYNLLNPLIEEKQKSLESEYNVQQLIFDLDQEMQWIDQSIKQVDLLTQAMPHTLFEAKNVSKKLAELDRIRINNHKTLYHGLTEKCQNMLESENKLSFNKLEQKMNEIESKWKNLEDFIGKKKLLVAKCLVEQEQLEEINQINIYLNEKMPILASALNDSVNESSINKNLTKLDHLAHDLREYNSMLYAKKPCSDLVKSKIEDTNQKVEEMLTESELRKKNLLHKLEALEFDRESSEFMKWMSEKRIQAQSEEFGHDFEHLIIISDKFDSLKDEVKLNDAKYERLRRRASDLLNTKSADSKLIHKRNDELKATYDQLANELGQRELLLNSAAAIHRFNKDAQDLNRRISEKEASFVTDLGKDLNSCEFLVRKHQTYIEELFALKIHLNDLNRESETLRAKHPGDTEESILSEMNDLIDRFNSLRLKSEKRTRDLNHSSDYYKFIVQSKDLNRWMEQIRSTLLTFIQPSDLYSVLKLIEEHKNLRSEISQRDDMFKKLEDLCIEIGQKKDNPYSKEILLATNDVMNSRESLFQLWTLKNRVLESQNECHEFYRDVNQLVLLINSQESILTKSFNELEQQLSKMSVISVEDLERVVKTNENLEKKIDKQSLERAIDLKKKAAQLLEKESARLNSQETEIYGLNEMHKLKDILNLILKKENDLREMCRKRTNQLNDALKFFRLYRDIDEFEMWIDDRIRGAKNLCQRTQSSALYDKIKLFQKQKALKSEIDSNFTRYTQLNMRGKDELDSNKSVSQQLMRTTLENLNKKWQALAYEINEREKEFEEAKDILEFNDELEKLEDWLKDKELMIQNGDVGRDYEHCIILLKKADDTTSPIHEDKLNKLIEMGNKLVRLGRTDQEMVAEKNDRLIERSKIIKYGIEAYKQKLVVALDIHLLMRDLDDIDQRIMDKINVLQVDVEHKNLDSVQVAQSKLNELKSELSPIEEKLDQVKNESLLVSSSTDEMIAKFDRVIQNWLNLNDLVEKKSIKLDSSYFYQKFMVEYRDLKSWIWDMANRIQQQSEPASLSEAETAINLHQERMTELEGKAHRILSLRDMAADLIQRKSNESNYQLVHKEISNFIKDIHQLEQELEIKASEKQKFLQQCAEYLEIKESWRQIENWSKQIETWLKSEEMGDSVLAVKSLLTKHENVENSVKSQMSANGSFDNLQQRVNQITRASNNAHLDQIQILFNQSVAKRKELSDLCANRRKQLDDSLMYQNLLLNYYDVIQWIREKTVTALEKTYTDLTNLETKIQRHQAFMIDLNKIGHKRVEDMHKEANQLLARHQTTLYSLSTSSTQIVANINEHLKDVDIQWNGLKTAAETKRKFLDDAYKYVLFTRFCEDLLAWFDEVESQLTNDDNGHDISSCKMLLLRHENLTKQIEAHQEKIQELDSYLLTNRDNFMLNEIQEMAGQVRERFAALKEPCQIRLDNLHESLSLFSVFHDMDDASQWLVEKMPLASIEELGFSLTDTHKLVKKHANLEQETSNQQSLIENVFKTAHKLVERKHYAHQLLSNRLAQLEKEWLVFKDLVSERRQKLDDALQTQKFLSESDDFIQYMKDKLKQLTSTDYGRNEQITLSYLKKLKSNDMQNQQQHLDLLGEQAVQLQGRKHTDKKLVQRKLTEMQNMFENLCDASSNREQHLNAMLSVFEFEREAEALVNWLRDQELIASSQDFGQDLEHAELLAKKFQQFSNYLNKNTTKIAQFDDLAQQLCENKFTPSAYIENIDERCSFINNIWTRLNVMADIRRKTLEGAIEVHAFDKDCDDLLAWASEKEKFLSNEVIGYDLASVYTLAKQQEALENELSSLSEELERLNSESKRLIENYPATKDHLESKLDQADIKYNQVLQYLSQRRDKIQNSQNMFVYANEFNELSEWLREMLVKLTSVELSPQHGLGEVNNAEMLIKKHREHKIEIDSQQSKIQKFLTKSEELLTKFSKNKLEKHEILSKIHIIQTNSNNLLETWSSRQDLYEQNLEYNKLLREIKYLDAWLSSKDAFVHTDLLGDSVTSVENLLKQHEDFERMLKAMETRFGNLKVENKLEKKLKEIREREAANRIKADAQFEEEKKKDAERKRKLEKKRQDERRRTQEIIANVSQNQIAANVSQSVGTTELSKNLEIKTQLESDQISKQVNSPKNAAPIRKKDRNRTRSIRDKHKILIGLSTPTITDYLMRKQEFQKGGQRAPIREYQPFYTSIHGNLMCFFIDKKDYNELNAATQPINLFNCKLNRIEDTTIQRDVLHVETADGAEYLFDAAGDEFDMEKMDLWMEKIFESSVSQNQSAPNTYNLTSTSNLNVSTGDLSSLTTQTSNKPRSRAPVVMSLPPIKSESIDIDQTNEGYYAQISSPLNKSTETQRGPIYENVPQNNSFNNVEETFAQDSLGQISEIKKAVSFDQTDIAPYRHREEPVAPVSPLSIGSVSDKVGHLDSTKGERRPPVSIIKKSLTYNQKEDTKLLRPVSVISEEGRGEPSTPRKMDKKESIVAEVLKQSAINSSQLSTDDMRHTSYNQAIQTKQIEREAGVLKSLVENLTKPVDNLNTSNISETNENSGIDNVNLAKQTSNTSDQNAYGIRNLLASEDKRAQTLPSKMDAAVPGSNLEAKSSFSGEKETKPKKNLFGSIFRKKKGKYEVKAETKTKDKK